VVVALLLLALVLAPATAGIWSWTRRRQAAAAPPVTAAGSAVGLAVAVVLGFLVARGDRPHLGDPDAAWLRADPLGVALALLVATLGVTILTYASRNLEGDARAWRFSALANGVLAATLLSSVAGRFSVLVVAWVLTSIGVVALIAYRGDGVSRAAARRAGLALGVGDAALVGALAIVLGTIGDPDLAGMGAAAADLGARQLSFFGLAEVGAAGVVAVLLVAAAAARASQLPFPLWLPGTLAAPTPVSALLHAGAVNAGGFLLVRLSPVLAESATAHVVLAVIALVTIVVTAGAALVRTDVKGALATSTSAQMGFMLLAVAVGAPLAAITHLIGHALYKASRFLGAGEALTAARVARRHRAAPPAAAGWRLVLSLAVPAAVLAAVVSLLDPSVLHDGEGWIIGVAVGAVGVRATWAWLGRGPLGVPRVLGAAAGFGLTLLGYLGLLVVLEHLLHTGVAVDVGASVDAPWALGGFLVAAALGALAARSPRTSPWILAPLSAVGQVPVPARHGRPPRSSGLRAPDVPALEGVW
jgi:NADH:ubiquinone oxidoreductase subunit 5 (subunit L)/multisubunit Na+/H+ antiporter MnhA subunit